MSAKGPREIELKLEVDPPAASALRTELLARLGDVAPVTLLSTYYDTPGQTLRGAGVSLRVRTGGGAPVQTVKRSTGSQTGLFDRDEWETALADGDPDFPAFARTPAGEALAIDPATLAPVFETVVERLVWQMATVDSDVEVAFDVGLAAARGQTDRIAEIELELKRGEPYHLFAALHAINPDGRLRPGVLTKSERGYRLTDPKVPRAFKAEPLHLTKSMSAAAAFQAVAHACLRHFWLNEPLVVATRAPEALHQTRVALRRLRSALSLFKPILADADFERLQRHLQDVSRHLGEARNLDVYLKATVRLEVAAGPEKPGDRAFLAAVETRRTEAYDDVLGRLRSAAFRDAMIDLLAWIEAGPWFVSDDPRQRDQRDMPIRAFAAAALEKRRRRIKRKGRHLDTLNPPARHRIRIEAKKLRYASEFFAGLARSEKSRSRQVAFTHALEHLQEHLGALNDIATGHEIAERFAHRQTDAQHGLAAAIELDEQQGARTAALLAAAAEAHTRFAATKRFWSSWPR